MEDFKIHQKIKELKNIPNFWRNRAKFCKEHNIPISSKTTYIDIAKVLLERDPLDFDLFEFRAKQIEDQLRKQKIWLRLAKWKKENNIPKSEHNSYRNFARILAKREEEKYKEIFDEIHKRIGLLRHPDGTFERQCFNEEGKITSYIDNKGKKVERRPFTYWRYKIIELKNNFFDCIAANLIMFLYTDFKKQYAPKPKNRIRFVLQKAETNPSQNKETISTPFTTFDKFQEVVEKKFGIKYDTLIMSVDDLLYFEVADEIKKYLPKGNAKAARLLSLAEKRAKHSVIAVNNTDDLCIERCIVTHIAREIYYHRLSPKDYDESFQKWEAIKKGTQKQGKRDVLTKLSKLFNEEWSAFDDTKVECNIEFYAKKYKVNIYLYHKAGELCELYKCKGEKKIEPIFLYMSEYDGKIHADLIVSITAFLGKDNKTNHFCEMCEKVHTNKCLKCIKKNKETVLNIVSNYKPSGIVQTGKYKCKNCNKWVPITHECNVAKTQLKRGNAEVYYWDSEATLSKMPLAESFVKGHPGVYHHTVSCIVCAKDTDKEDDFKVYDDVSSFVDYFMELPKLANPSGKKASRIPIIFFAHNSSKYDTHFIMKELYSRGYDNCHILGPISNLFCLTIQTKYGPIYFKDSCKFIQRPLKEFPKIFGLQDARKGDFPYMFNTPENKGYCGPIPDKKFFSTNRMSDKELEEFNADHSEWLTSGRTYNLRREEILYCKNDVFVLQQGFNKFRKDFTTIAIEHTDIDIDISEIPLYGDPVHYNTNAGIDKNYYTSLFMITESLPVLEQAQKGKLQSKKALMWLSQFKGLKYEYKISNGLTVDGYDEETNTVYEFYGDFLHGNLEVYEAQQTNLVTKTRFAELYQKTMAREKTIKDCGYNFVTIWEEDFNFDFYNDNTKEERKEIEQAALEQLKETDDIYVRDSFFGGRTEVFSQYFDAYVMGEKLGKNVNINYADICSLYPTVMYYDWLPTGKTHNYKNLTPPEVLGILNSGKMGIVKCNLVPPKDLLHPVCAAKKNGKLMFDLIPDIYTITSVELLKAVEKGYQITKVYSALIFESRTNNMFKEYIKVFLKIKTEASGLEDGQTKEELIKEYKDTYDIDLDPEKIMKNPGRRFIAKLCLNSLWGKFGQRNDFTNHKIISQDPLNILKEIYNPNIDIVDYDSEIIEDKVHISYTQNYPTQDISTSIVTALFITANARLRLYDLFEKVGNKLLYADTDSIIYYHIEGEEDPIKLGSRLGDLTDEIGGGAKGKIFASTGPKSYSLQTTKPEKDIFHCKGITLDRETKKLLNKETMKDIVTKKLDKIIVEQNVIRCTKRHDLYSYKQEKEFKNTFDKRQVLEPEYFMGKLLRIDTLPFGYDN